MLKEFEHFESNSKYSLSNYNIQPHCIFNKTLKYGFEFIQQPPILHVFSLPH